MYYKRKRYYCFNCGAVMEKEGSMLICPDCGRTWTPKNNFVVESDEDESDDYSYFSSDEEYERDMRWERNRGRGEWNRDNDPDFYAHCEDGWDDWED